NAYPVPPCTNRRRTTSSEVTTTIQSDLKVDMIDITKAKKITVPSPDTQWSSDSDDQSLDMQPIPKNNSIALHPTPPSLITRLNGGIHSTRNANSIHNIDNSGDNHNSSRAHSTRNDNSTSENSGTSDADDANDADSITSNSSSGDTIVGDKSDTSAKSSIDTSVPSQKDPRLLDPTSWTPAVGQSFETRDAAFDLLQSWASGQGFTLGTLDLTRTNATVGHHHFIADMHH
ncbi:hypothetical protein BGZ83_002171, partial [Gryganskiella cystojenkinii]